MLFSYLTKGLHVARAGKALAGWKATQEVVTASLDAIDQGARNRLDNMTKILFDFGPKVFATKKGNLYALRNVLMAALLKDLTAFLALTGEQSSFFKEFFGAAKKARIKQSELMDWGVLIKKDFEQRNLSLAGKCTNNADFETAFRHMNASLLDVQAEVVTLSQANHNLESQMKEMAITIQENNKEMAITIQENNSKLDSVLELLTSTLMITGDKSAARKRVRISDVSDNVSVADSTDNSTNSFAGLASSKRKSAAPDLSKLVAPKTLSQGLATAGEKGKSLMSVFVCHGREII
jgi:hypothetical protein